MTSKQIQLRRGTTIQHTTFTGADGEVTVDTTTHGLRVHDGATPGGITMARLCDIIPDYASGVPLTAPTTTATEYIAPMDGFFYISFFGCNNAYAYVKINGEYAVNITSPSSTIYSTVSQYFPVRAGDVIEYCHSQATAANWVCAKFMPARNK